jgi:hypothetical protein
MEADMISNLHLDVAEANSVDEELSLFATSLWFDTRERIFSNFDVRAGDVALEYNDCERAWLMVGKRGARVATLCTPG